VASEGDEVACFQHVAEVFNGLVHGQQLSIVGAVFLLGWVEFLGVEGKGLQGVNDTLLQDDTHGGSEGVCDD
jgi:hypothetical protein